MRLIFFILSLILIEFTVYIYN